jgi:sorbitol-specific phosphotransferase system component IIA
MCVAIASASQRKPGHSAISASIVAMLHGKVDVITAQEAPKNLEDGSTAHLQEITYVDNDPAGNTRSLNMVVAAAQAVADTLNAKLARIHITVVDKNRRPRSRIVVTPLPDPKLRLKWLSAVMKTGPDLSKAEKALISEWASSWKIERIDKSWKCMLEGKWDKESATWEADLFLHHFLPLILLGGIGIGVPILTVFSIPGCGARILISLSGGSGCGPSAMAPGTNTTIAKSAMKANKAVFFIESTSSRTMSLLEIVREKNPNLTVRLVS